MGPAKAYAMRDLVSDLSLLLEHLKIKKCTIIGHSIGGIIASMYAAQFPNIVDAIILINSSPKKFQDSDLEKHFATRKIAIQQGMTLLAEHGLRRFDESRDLFKSKKHSDFFKEVFTKTTVDGFIAATLALYSIPDDVAQRLQSSQCMVFAIVGSHDDVFTRLLEEARDEIPKMEIRILKEADHWVIIEKPKEGFDLLVEFLEKVKRK
jgi:pimeloyl-ACP methyl ester carboxylesterase